MKFVNFAAPIIEVGGLNGSKMLDREYIIPFVGLKIGMHEFEFNVDDKFFESIEYSLIQKGNVHVHFTLDKKETMMIGQFRLDGVVHTACDRCSAPLKTRINGEYQLIYKFGNEPAEDESLVIVYPEEFEINLKDSINEFVTVSLPARVVHENEEDCDEEMLELLNEYMINSNFHEAPETTIEDEEELDPRWAALKKLKK